MCAASSLRPVRTPKLPFLVAHVLLASFAVYLVFFGPDPWSMSSLLLVALCLGGGGLLTALPFFLDHLSRQNLLHHQSGQLALNLSAALDRSDQITASLEKLREGNSPLHLIADQLPGLVEEKLGEAIERQLLSQSTLNRQILEKIAGIEVILGDLPGRISTGQRLDATLREEVRELGLLLEDLVDRLGPSDGAARPAPASHVPEVAAAPEKVPPVEPGEVSAEPVSADEPAEVPGAEPEPGEAGEQEESGPEEAGATEGADAPPADPVAAKASVKSRKPRTSRLTVSAFIGIQNKIYLRGDGPNLSRETGLLLPMTGIGEWEWQEALAGPAALEIFLNDQTPANLGTLTLMPGEQKVVHPSFAKE